MIFRQHIPNFVTADPFEFEFNSLDELFSHEWLKDRMLDNKFHRFSQNEYHGSLHLMQEIDEGYSWWVLGGVKGVTDIGLPKWKTKYRKK